MIDNIYLLTIGTRSGTDPDSSSRFICLRFQRTNTSYMDLYNSFLWFKLVLNFACLMRVLLELGLANDKQRLHWRSSLKYLSAYIDPISRHPHSCLGRGGDRGGSVWIGFATPFCTFHQLQCNICRNLKANESEKEVPKARIRIRICIDPNREIRKNEALNESGEQLSRLR